LSVVDEIVALMLCELVRTIDVENLVSNCCFDDWRIIICFDLWIEWYVL